MRKHFFPILSLMMICISCTKSDLQVAGSASKTTAAIENFKSSREFQTQIQKYSLLTAEERYQIWSSHLAKAKAQFLGQGRADKAGLADNLLENISVAGFSENSSTARDVLLNYFMPTWYKGASKILTSQEIYDLTSDPSKNIIGEVVQSRFADPVDDPAGCFCHVGDNGFSCKKWTYTLSIPPSVSVEYGTCEQSGACTSSSMGCSWFWLSSCNGNHCNY